MEFQGALCGFVVGWDIFMNASVVSLSTKFAYDCPNQ
jgi:hypothetical protein